MWDLTRMLNSAGKHEAADKDRGYLHVWSVNLKFRENLTA